MAASVLRRWQLYHWQKITWNRKQRLFIANNNHTGILKILSLIFCFVLHLTPYFKKLGTLVRQLQSYHLKRPLPKFPNYVVGYTRCPPYLCIAGFMGYGKIDQLWRCNQSSSIGVCRLHLALHGMALEQMTYCADLQRLIKVNPSIHGNGWVSYSL